MSTGPSPEARNKFHKALAANFGILLYKTDLLHQETINTMREMIEVTRVPYDFANKKIKGDTLDRHPWHCYGNLSEVVTLMTLVWHDYAWLSDTRFLRDQTDQVGSMIDLNVGHATYQVKSAVRGQEEYGSQLFVREEDLMGTAEYMAYVCHKTRVVYKFNRATFRQDMKAQFDIGGPYNTWWKEPGWFVTPEDAEFIDRLPIPTGVVCAYYNYDTGTVSLSNGV